MKNIVILALFSALFFSACADKADTSVAKSKLQFLDSLGKSKVLYTDEEKIERIMKFYKSKLANMEHLDIRFLEKVESNEDLAFDAFVFEVKVNGAEQKEIIFVKDNFFFTNFVSLETFDTSKDKAFAILNKKNNEKIIDTLRAEYENYFITLGIGAKEVFVFSDPLCPFCKEHLESIDESYLQNHTIHFIFTSVHKDAGFKRVQLIYENIKNSFSDKDKLKMIKYYYSDSVTQDPLYLGEIDDLKSAYKAFTNLGVKYVPYIIED